MGPRAVACPSSQFNNVTPVCTHGARAVVFGFGMQLAQTGHAHVGAVWTAPVERAPTAEYWVRSSAPHPLYSDPDPKDELPSDSLYQDAWPEISQVASGSLRGMSASEFAEHLVKEVLSGKAGLIWAGRMSEFAWFLEQWVPQCLVVCYYI